MNEQPERIHRRCADCTFWNDAPRAECRRRPPTPNFGWPQASADDWCGRFVSHGDAATAVVVGQKIADRMIK